MALHGQSGWAETFQVAGAAGTGALAATNLILTQPARLIELAINCGTGPSAANFVVDINKNGSSIYTSANQKPQIVLGSTKLHPYLVTYAALSAQQQLAVANGLPGGQVTNFTWTGWGFKTDFSTGGGGPTPTTYGAGAPASTLGNVGDWYVDVTNFRLYGPKQGVAGQIAAGWPSTYTTLTAFNAIPAATGIAPAEKFAAGDVFQFAVTATGTSTADVTYTVVFEWQ